MATTIDRIKRRYRDDRDIERIRFHYDVERELAGRLRGAAKAQRGELYRRCYDELFARVSDHPQVVGKRGESARAERHVEKQLRLLRPLVRPGDTYLEVGAGDCALALRMCGLVAKCYAIDVSEVIAAGRAGAAPANFELVISDGTSIPVPAGSVDLAYSNQLMEHLHPDDAAEQLANIHRALKPGGRYLCMTPSRLTGPHDVSRYFDAVATGFHLKEYSYAELFALMRSVGFRRFRILLRQGGFYAGTVPAWLAGSFERLFEAVPRDLTRRFAKTKAAGLLLGVNVLAER